MLNAAHKGIWIAIILGKEMRMKSLRILFCVFILALAACNSSEAPNYTNQQLIENSANKVEVGINDAGSCTDEFMDEMAELRSENSDLVSAESLINILEFYSKENKQSLGETIDRLDATRKQCAGHMIQFISKQKLNCENSKIYEESSSPIYGHSFESISSFCSLTNDFQRNAQKAWDEKFSMEKDNNYGSEEGRLRKVKDSYSMAICDDKFVSTFNEFLNTREKAKKDFNDLKANYPYETAEEKRQYKMVVSKIHAAHKAFKNLCPPLAKYTEIFGPCIKPDGSEEILFHRRIINFCSEAIKDTNLGFEIENEILPNR